MSGWDSIYTIAACPVCLDWPRERNGERCPECGDRDHPGFVFINERGFAPPTMSRAYYERKLREGRAALDRHTHQDTLGRDEHGGTFEGEAPHEPECDMGEDCTCR